MQLGMRKFVVFTGGVCLAGGAWLIVACSSDSSTSSGGVANVEAGGDTGGNPPPPPPPPGSGDGGDGGGGADCTAIPKIRDNSNGFYCAFVPKLPDGGKQDYCSNTQECCGPGKNSDGGFPDSYCTADDPKPNADPVMNCANSAADAGSTWNAGSGSTFECADKNNCGSGQICVLTGTGITFQPLTKNAGKDVTGCGAVYAKGATGTRCCTPGADCPKAPDEKHLCGMTDTCATGTCTPFSGVFRDLAYCK